jgi:hypothetical protein
MCELGDVPVSVITARHVTMMPKYTLHEACVRYFNEADTERRGRVVKTPTLYSGGLEFKSRPGDVLY